MLSTSKTVDAEGGFRSDVLPVLQASYGISFRDVTQLGYGRAAVNCVWVALLMLGLAAGATALDGRLRTAR